MSGDVRQLGNNSNLHETLMDIDDSNSRFQQSRQLPGLADCSAIGGDSVVVNDSKINKTKGFSYRNGGSSNFGIAAPLFVPNDVTNNYTSFKRERRLSLLQRDRDTEGQDQEASQSHYSQSRIRKLNDSGVRSDSAFRDILQQNLGANLGLNGTRNSGVEAANQSQVSHLESYLNMTRNLL